jgi:hypothetical protein
VAGQALMMEALQTSETLVNLYQSTWRYNPEDSHLQIHFWLENQKGRDDLEDLDIDRKRLKWVLKK